MKNMVVASITMLLAASACGQVAADPLNNTSSNQIVSPTTIDINSKWWKGTGRYEIANIEGYREAYPAGESIEFYVAGKSDKLRVNKENGFYVSAALHDLTKPSAHGAIIEYDSEKHAWKVKLTAPTDTAKEYKISVHLLCGGGSDTPCAVAYANGARLDKDLTFRFGDAVAQ